MANDRAAVLQKFSGLHVIARRQRRIDFKGDRRRVNLRIPEEVLNGLQLIKVATGEDKNSFCERILTEAIRTKIQELRSRHDEAAWQALKDVAQRKRAD